MQNIMNIFLNIRITDVLDILIIAFIFYKFLMLVKETSAEQLIKGLIIILIASKLSEWAQLNMIYFLLRNMMTIGVVALLIVFQPELRQALEYIGRSKLLRKSEYEMRDKELDEMVSELCEAAKRLSKSKTGALIVIERETGLKNILSTGIYIDGILSATLLCNIFYHNSPMHDGAVLVRKNRVAAASCLLPLSENQHISKDLGTRHRAALGLAEKTDSIVIVVSEETGVISLALDGKLSRFIDVKTLSSILRSKFKIEERPETTLLGFWRVKNGKKN